MSYKAGLMHVYLKYHLNNLGSELTAIYVDDDSVNSDPDIQFYSGDEQLPVTVQCCFDGTYSVNKIEYEPKFAMNHLLEDSDLQTAVRRAVEACEAFLEERRAKSHG